MHVATDLLVFFYHVAIYIYATELATPPQLLFFVEVVQGDVNIKDQVNHFAAVRRLTTLQTYFMNA